MLAWRTTDAVVQEPDDENLEDFRENLLVCGFVAALILVADLTDSIIDTCIDLRISVERQGAGLVQVTAADSADLARLSGTGAGASRPMRRRARKSTTAKSTRKAKGNSDDTHGSASA